MIERAVKDFLLDSATVRDRVAGRIFHSRAPQGIKGELIVIRTINMEPVYTIQNEAGLEAHITQIDCYSDTPYKADTLGDLVRNRLSGYRGTIGNDAVLIEATEIINARSLEDQPEDSSDRWIFRHSADYRFYASKAIPTHT